jgi:hypothetical protein
VQIIPGWAGAVEAPQLKSVFFVVMQFKVGGVEQPMAVWAVSRAAYYQSDRGQILAANKSAQEFTTFRNTNDAAHIREDNINASEVQACSLS